MRGGVEIEALGERPLRRRMRVRSKGGQPAVRHPRRYPVRAALATLVWVRSDEPEDNTASGIDESSPCTSACTTTARVVENENVSDAQR